MMNPKTVTPQQIKDMSDRLTASLSEDDLKYAKDEERGEYRGFAALHDLMDANVVLDEIVIAYGFPWGDDDEHIELLNAVSSKFNEAMLSDGCDEADPMFDPMGDHMGRNE
jgi:hypothetical protein